MPSPVMHSLETTRAGKYPRVYNPDTGETIYVQAPVWYKTDFLSGGTTFTAQTTDIFNKKIVGSGPPTLAYQASTPEGVLLATHEATSQVQVAGIDFGDNLSIDITKQFGIEVGVTITASAMTAQQFAMGFGTAHADTVTSYTAYLFARLNASFALYLEGNDGTGAGGPTSNGVYTDATAKTLVTATYYVIRISTSDILNCALHVNETRVDNQLPVNMIGVSSTNKKMQPVVRWGKTTGTTTNTMALDYVAFWGDR